ncbi:MAG TPA: iron-sulfur cluster carrier protein ApbC [Candidatus Sumerlaeota bacterium]|nr:iron-sulfur cluster carrier protein ApbC [Candidatus Sumerlaeota bacterium]HNM45959.1 iron-sulfur cluster carrier protein ApbC [Candidatus Sumerlaeota bacterium]
MPDLKEQILSALRVVQDPDLHQDIVTLGFVRSVTLDAAGKANVTICLTTPACPVKDQLKVQAEQAIRGVPGVTDVSVIMTAEVRSAKPDGNKAPIEGVRNIIAVGSGKGGVGKSTTAVNLAIALGKMGARTGVLDADIYGPNVPGMLGATGRPKVIDNRIIPMPAHGIVSMSMGYMIDTDTPLVWRGPMLHGVMKQLLHEVKWGSLDYLVIDLPPGTGDVQLSLSQTAPVTGAVIVTTPQNVALQDARRAVAMFQKVNVPILGIIENMSYYLCPKCSHRDEIFDSAGGENTASRLGVPFLGRIPLNTTIRESMDVGRPVAVTDGEYGKIYEEIAQRVAQQVSLLNTDSKRPIAVVREK